jgi:hypothetical protein
MINHQTAFQQKLAIQHVKVRVRTGMPLAEALLRQPITTKYERGEKLNETFEKD